MTTIGSIKTQITKAAKALKASMEEAEKLRAGQVPSDAPAEQAEDAPGVLEEFRAHWTANACAESIEEAERLVLELGTARVQLERQTPSSGGLPEVNTVADSIGVDGRQPSTPSQERPTDRGPAQPSSGPGGEQLAPRRENSQTPSAPMASLNGTPASQGASAQFNHDPIQSVKLPPFELPEFKGDMHAFPEFWEMFAVAVHDNPTVPTISKFLYLKGKLKGEAYKLISPLQFSEYNYQQAVQLLKKTYMRPDILRIQLVQELQAVPPAHDIPTSQRTTLCTLKALWVQLEKLGEHPASTAHKCTIGEKFPLRTMEKAGELKNAGEDWTVNHLLDALTRSSTVKKHSKESTQPWRRHTSPSSTVHARQPEQKHGVRHHAVTTPNGVGATHQGGTIFPKGVVARSVFVENTSRNDAMKFQRSTPGGKS
ncbi:unnamed protein product [Heligmosomoides polygyrus]|uniref:Gag_p10 domain-containing protein n=1 Tax=Heligmosomoides polygyrus TaxID=6339 RepID=A0A183F8K6_HELPZ|nr:unnamed protein product [Heligmosomoides polygyrus]